MAQLEDELGNVPDHPPEVAPGAPGAIPEPGKTCFGIVCPPLVEALAADSALSAYSTYVANLLKAFEPCQPHSGTALYNILVYLVDFLCLGFGSHALPLSFTSEGPEWSPIRVCRGSASTPTIYHIS